MEFVRISGSDRLRICIDFPVYIDCNILLVFSNQLICVISHARHKLTAVREQLVDLGLSEYGGSEMLSHLAELEKSGYDTNVEGHISTDCLRHIILDLGKHCNFSRGLEQ